MSDINDVLVPACKTDEIKAYLLESFTSAKGFIFDHHEKYPILTLLIVAVIVLIIVLESFCSHLLKERAEKVEIMNKNAVTSTTAPVPAPAPAPAPAPGPIPGPIPVPVPAPVSPIPVPSTPTTPSKLKDTPEMFIRELMYTGVGCLKQNGIGQPPSSRNVKCVRLKDDNSGKLHFFKNAFKVSSFFFGEDQWDMTTLVSALKGDEGVGEIILEFHNGTKMIVMTFVIEDRNERHRVIKKFNEVAHALKTNGITWLAKTMDEVSKGGHIQPGVAVPPTPTSLFSTPTAAGGGGRKSPTSSKDPLTRFISTDSAVARRILADSDNETSNLDGDGNSESNASGIPAVDWQTDFFQWHTSELLTQIRKEKLQARVSVSSNPQRSEMIEILASYYREKNGRQKVVVNKDNFIGQVTQIYKRYRPEKTASDIAKAIEQYKGKEMYYLEVLYDKYPVETAADLALFGVGL